MASPEPLEISDLIVDYDPETLERRPVRRSAVIERLIENGQARAARIVEKLSASNDILDPRHCDAVLLRSHIELQRLSEEMRQADRLRATLLPLLDALREAGVKPPLRVVDVGCGLGYVIRALAAHGRLGRDVELVGCDMNAELVRQAQKLAEAEALTCELVVANAFRLAQPGHIFISTGVVHHFRGPSLEELFRGQRQGWGFLHFDMRASALTPLGSWMFHSSRMREPLARHDGVASARRAHDVNTLLSAARKGTDFTCAALDGSRGLFSVIIRPMVGVLGTRPALWPAFTRKLGPLATRVTVVS